METRTISCSLSVICFLLASGVRLLAAEECKIEQKHICGVEDCNCRYVSPSTSTLSSLYKRFLALLSLENYDGNVCDKCHVFCIKEKQINCYHGACDKTKGCVCRHCWSGKTCSKYQNNEYPKFEPMMYEAEINVETSVGEQILQVSAVDSDFEMCIDKDDCPCGRVQYSISKGNRDGFFYIDSETGIVRVNKQLLGATYFSPFILHIVAENTEVESFRENESLGNSAVATISVVHIKEHGARKRRSTHHRTRRSLETYNALTTKFSPLTNSSFCDPGCSIDFRLFVSHNASSSPEKLKEIFVRLSSTYLDINITSLVLNISDSTKAVGSINKADSDTIEFSVAEELNISDYMEILFETKMKNSVKPLSLLQVSFTMNATDETATKLFQYGPQYSTAIYAAYPEITFMRNSNEVVTVEKTLDYNVNITLPYFNFSLIFEISTTVNKFRFLSIENVVTGPISSSVEPQIRNPSPMEYTSADDNITSRVVLDFGHIKVLNRNQNENTMKLRFSVKVHDHYLLENDSTHWVGIGVRSGDEMLWVGQASIKICKDEPFLIAEIQTLNDTAPTRYYMNDLLLFSWDVTHANASYATAKDVNISFIFAKSLIMKTIDINVLTTKTQFTDEIGRTEVKHTLEDSSFLQSSNASGIVQAMVKNESVTPLSDLNVEIKLYYRTPDNVDRPVKTYAPDPGYVAGVPTFNLSSNMSGRAVKIGNIIDVSLQILIQKISLLANIEVVLPVQNKSAVMVFVPQSFTLVSVGSNVGGNQLNSPKLTLNSTMNDSIYFDRATFDLGLVHNKLLSPDSIAILEDNMVTLSFQVLLDDHKYICNGTKYWLGVGVRGGRNMAWIAQLAFIADVPPVRRPRLQIDPSTNGTNTMKQGEVVDYNFTVSHTKESDAYAFDVEILWMMPAYTILLEVLVKPPEVNFSQSHNNLLFKFSKLHFVDKPLVSFSIALDPEKTLKPGINFAVTPIVLTYKDNTKNETFFEPLVPVSVEFTVPSLSPPKTNAVDEFYNRGFLVDNHSSAIYVCKVSYKRNKPSCFWTNDKGAVWRAVDFLVINIIGIDSTNNMVYGIGNNKLAYMKYVPEKQKWFSIQRDHWQQAKSKLSDKNPIVIDDTNGNEGEIEGSKEHIVGNGEKWGANKTGIYYYTTSKGWERKAAWDCCKE